MSEILNFPKAPKEPKVQRERSIVIKLIDFDINETVKQQILYDNGGISQMEMIGVLEFVKNGLLQPPVNPPKN